ncbi:MAG: hypothetical protein WC455_29450 [Dehalococcoidia bacterium]
MTPEQASAEIRDIIKHGFGTVTVKIRDGEIQQVEVMKVKR